MSRIMNKKGFSLSEMLVAVLIVVMVVALVAGGGKVAKNAYQRVTLRAEASTLMSTTITKVTDEFRFARDIKTETLELTSAKRVTFLSGVEGYKIYMDNVPQQFGDATKTSIQIIPVAQPTSFFPLLTDKTLTNGLVPTISNIAYDNGIITATISIFQNELSKTDAYMTQTISVRPLND